MTSHPGITHYQYEFQPDTRRPQPLPPAGAWDCQIHVFGDRDAYPLAATRWYDPPFHATFDLAQNMHATLGIARAVLVQPAAYGTDFRLLLACLAANPSYRATTLIDDSVSDAQLHELHTAGVRGIRFHFKSSTGPVPDARDFERAVERIAPLGWHVKVRTTGDDLLRHEALFRRVADVPIVIDHMGHLEMKLGVDQPACRTIVDLLRSAPNFWVMLSNAPKHSDPPYDDAVAIGRAFVAAAPDRVIWGSDWPHLDFRKPVPNTADLLELAYRYAPDAAALQKIFVTNPGRLYDAGV
jgi:predicted TIM-barrel fold metal-dependent hydrolase